jgi:hypothetical protein
MLKYLLHYLLFGMTMFAAADVAVGGDGDGAAPADAGGSGGNAGAGDAGADLGGDDGSGPTVEGDIDGLGELDSEPAEGEQRQQQPEVDKETGDLKGLVSKRLLALKKEAPELTGIFQKYPKVQEQVEAAFRRDMAYRELYPTVAEARQMREQFPNGMADVEQLLTDVGEVEQLDQQFYQKDAQGNYTGHAAIVQNMFQDDREAAVSLFRTLPKEWARLDPDSYNEVMGQVVGATLQRAELPEWITELRDAAKTAKQDGLAASLDKMLRWASGFNKRKAEPSEDEQRLQGQREQFKRETDERKKQDFTRFSTNFFAESQKQQTAIVRKHPAVAEMLQTKALSEQKKNEIITKIQTRIREHVKTSRAYMTKLRAAYNSGNLQESLTLEKAQWSYPWVLNKFVRAVLAEETPTLVRQNRERTRGAAQQLRRPEQRQQQQRREERTGPYQEGKVWHKKDGSRFTTAEILRGLHLQNS